MTIQVTGVIIKKVFINTESMLKGIASVILNEGFMVNNIRILCNDNRVFIAMPNEKRKDEIYIDIVHPINKEARAIIEEAVLSAYVQALDEKLAEEAAAQELTNSLEEA